MVFIRRDTFDMIRTDLPRIMQSNNYFAVDELIAPPIQIFNRKGYITQWCCSGHPYAYITEGYKNGDPELKIIETPEKGADNTYILFKEGISLPFLPPGFVNNSFDTRLGIIKFYHFQGDFFEIFKIILETMDQLYNWALELPYFGG